VLDAEVEFDAIFAVIDMPPKTEAPKSLKAPRDDRHRDD